MRSHRVVIAIGLVASMVSCAGLGHEVPEYMKANPLLQEEIDSLVRDLPHMHGPELLAAISRLITIGEPAIPALIGALNAEPSQTRSSSAYVLGEIHDRRVISDLRGALDDTDVEVRYEVAASLVVLGDWTAIPTLIAALRDGNAYNRYKAFRVLSEQTHQDLGYEYQAPVEERLAAVRRWESWYAGLRVTRVE